MSRLVGYFANDRYGSSYALEPLREQLAPGGKGPSEGFGVGYYNGDEVLMNKHPSRDPARIDFAEAVRELRSDCILMHRRRPTAGALNPENTHPFRFRRWLFAHHGDVPGMEQIRDGLLSEIPDHLRRSIKGATDSEVIFMTFMTFVHHENKIDDPNIDPSLVADLLRATIWRVRSLLEKVDAPEPTLDLVVTNGRMMAGTHVGRTLHYTLREGVRSGQVGEIGEPDGGPEGEMAGHALSRFRAVVLSYGHDPETANGWVSVPEGSIVSVDRELNVQVAKL